MKRKMFIAYIVCIHIALGAAFFRMAAGKTAMVKPATAAAPSVPSEITEHFHHMMRYHARMDGNVPSGAVVFVGDSITQGLCVAAVSPAAVNYGIGYDTTAGVLQRLPAYRSITRAGAVVLAIGINDFRLRTNAEILDNYARMGAMIPEYVPVIFSAVLPLDEKAFFDCQGWNKRARTLNAGLRDLCSRTGNRFFVDIGSLLVDDQGNLARQFHDGDGIHLNAQGNEIWIRELQKTLAKIRPQLAAAAEPARPSSL